MRIEVPGIGSMRLENSHKHLKTLFLITLSILYSGSMWAVDCQFANTIFLETQEEVDNFQLNWGGGMTCDTITGNLWIEELEVLNLDGISDIESIEGDFLIRDTSITNVDPLLNLVSVGGFFGMSFNLNLLNFDGLANLANITEAISIQYNGDVVTLDPLASAFSTASDISIGNHDLLTHISALSGVTALSGSFSFTGCPLVNNLDDLGNLNSIGEDLWISSSGLSSISGLSNLNSVGNSMTIIGNQSLTSFVGLDGISSIPGGLSITGNNALTDISGLANISQIGISLRIQENAILTNLDGFSGLLNIGDELNIERHPKLQNINGLSSLNFIGDDVSIIQNEMLENLDGLGSVTTMGGRINISSNPNLVSIEGLSGLSGTIAGYLILQNEGLTNLDGLDGITEIMGNFWIGGGQVSDFDGIANLTTVWGDLSITGMDMLTDLSPFSNISFVGRNLQIAHNDALQSLAGLEALSASINDNITISYNNTIEDISGLSGLTATEGYLRISDNPSLLSINDLSSLSHIGNRLDIEANDSLESIDGLSGLLTVDSIRILNNPSLLNVDGLRNLQAVDTPFLRITFNDSLQNLNGLSSLIDLRGSLTVVSNPALTNCRGIIPLIDSIDDGDPGPGGGSIPDVGVTVSFSGNGTGCNELQPILDAELSTMVEVEKTFSDGRPVDTEIVLNCEPSTVIVPFPIDTANSQSPALFEVNRYVPGFFHTCSASELDSVAGYTPDESDCTHVQLTQVGIHPCEIINQQDAKVLSVNKSYTFTEPGGGPEVRVTVSCPTATIAPGTTQFTSNGMAEFELSEFPWDGEFCSVIETVPENYIQLENTNCSEIAIMPDGQMIPMCEFVNEVIGAPLLKNGFEESAVTE
ncbi:MAG: hypothetical protein ACR2QW_12140 [bacterium]